MQSKKQSLLESSVSTAVGLILALATQFFIVNPMLGVHDAPGRSILAVAIFTVISIWRQYVLRRFFNKYHSTHH